MRLGILVLTVLALTSLCLAEAARAEPGPGQSSKLRVLRRGPSEGQDPARWRVYFDTGSSFDVAWAGPDDPDDERALTTRLELLSGGTLRVESARILRMEELEVPEVPEAPVARVALGSASARWEQLVSPAAQRHGLTTELVLAIIDVESSGNPRAVSHRGATGLMQLLPSTASDYGLSDLTDPATNIEAGCRHLARLSKIFGDDLDLLLAAYNAGEGAVARFGGVPAYTETRRYLELVKARLATSPS